MPTVWNALFLGNIGTQIDSVEGDNDLENESVLINQTFGSAGAPMADQVVRISANDTDGNATILEQNNAIAQDEITFDLGSGPQTTVFDGGGAFNVTIRYMDPSLPDVSEPAPVLQDTEGNVFLGPPTATGSLQQALEAGGIESITITSVIQDRYDGMLVDRYDPAFVCFCGATLIDTPDGPRRADALARGDPVLTEDSGARPVRWIGKRRLTAADLAAAPHLLPIRIAPGALGRGLPRRDLRVSPQHRILLQSRIAARMGFGKEVLVAAKKLTGQPGIAVDACARNVTYVHFLFDRHEIVRAEGAPCESLYTGPEALRAIGPAARCEIATLFPHLADQARPRPARPILSGRRLRSLIARHRRNARPFLERPVV